MANRDQMKSWERTLAFVGIIIAIGGAVQGALILPYRVEQGEKAHAQLVTDFKVEKAKSEDLHDGLIRIEEQLKSVKITVESIDKRQRFSASNPN